MSIYDRFSATAKSLISKFNTGHISLVQKTGTLDPLSGTISGGETVTVLNAIEDNIRKELVDGEHVQSTDRIILADNAVRPSTDDLIRIGSNDYVIIEVRPISPGGKDIYFEVVVRG
jgi:hypothetical protein